VTRRPDERNTSRYWLDRRTPGLSLFRADFTTHEFPAHTHEALLVAVTEDGGSEIAAAREAGEVHRAALLVVNPVEAHSSRMRSSRRWRYRSFYLMRSALADVGQALGLDELPGFGSRILHEPDLVDGFLRLHRALERGEDDLRERELLVAAFGSLVRRHGAQPGRVSLPPRDAALLRAVVDLMRERCADHLTLPELAAAAGTTQFQLIGLFRRGTGLTPHAYLTQLRLGAACHHLRRGLPIAEAATTAGFYDQSALTRHFKRCYGMTPLQYVRAIRS
jgi:AraC-like DNA-binding protein